MSPTSSGSGSGAKPWERSNPKTKAARRHLTPAQKLAAKARADEAGRRYPNLVDNMWALSHVEPGDGQQ